MKQSFFNPTEEFVDRLVEIINDRFVIEIGCGRGDLLASLIDKGLSCIGIDPYVDIMNGDINKKVSTKILPLQVEQVDKFINNIKKDKVFIVARPCHSGFPEEYLNYFGRDHELIYIGFAKNLEVDFERELSFIRFVDFPLHEDCDSVAILKKLNFDERDKESVSWERVDRRVKELKGEIDKDLLKWFKSIDSKNYIKLSEETSKIIAEKYPDKNYTGGGHYGGYWGEYEGCELIGRDIVKKKKVTLDISTFMVGGGHFSCNIDVDNDTFLQQDENNLNELKGAQPWDHISRRPEWVKNNLSYFGLRDSKRTLDLEAGLQWLKNSFESFSKRYKEEVDIELIPIIGSGLEYELESF